MDMPIIKLAPPLAIATKTVPPNEELLQNLTLFLIVNDYVNLVVSY